MRPIQTFNNTQVKVFIGLERSVYLSISGRAKGILKDVATHHLPIRRIEKQLIASGRLPMDNIKAIIEKIKNDKVSKHSWGQGLQIFIN